MDVRNGSNLSRLLIFCVLFLTPLSLSAQEILFKESKGSNPGRTYAEVLLGGSCGNTVLLIANITQANHQSYSFVQDTTLIDSSIKKLLSICSSVKEAHLLVQMYHQGQPMNSPPRFRLLERNGWRLLELPQYDAPDFLWDYHKPNTIKFSAKGKAGIFELVMLVERDGSTKGYFNRFNLGKEFKDFSGKAPMKFSGQFAPSAKQTNVVEQVSTGHWQYYGGEHSCKKTKEGYALWGDINLSLSQKQSLTLTMCPGDGNSKTEEYELTFMKVNSHDEKSAQSLLYGMFAIAPGTPVNAENANIAASETFVSAYDVQWDPINKLQYLHFNNSKFLFRDKQTDFYLAEDTSQYFANSSFPNRDAVFVAVHSVNDSQPLINLEIKPTNVVDLDWKLFMGVDANVLRRMAEEDPGRPTYKIPEETIQYYGKEIAAKLFASARGVNPGTILHYNKNETLMNGPKLRRIPDAGSKPGYIMPVFTTEFEKISEDQYRPWYEQRNPNNDPNHLWREFVAGEGHTTEAALANRQYWFNAEKDAKEIWNASDEGLQAIFDKKRADKDQFYLARANASATEYRNFAYWSEYKNRGLMKAVFDGMETYGYLRNSNWFEHVYVRYHSAYYAYCNQNVPANSNGFSITEHVEERHGGYFGFSVKYDRFVGEAKIRQAYWPTFENYYENLKPPVNAIHFANNMSRMSIKEMFGEAKLAAAFFLDIKMDMDRLFEQDCNSQFLKQFETNLQRIATNQKTLQQQSR